MHINYKQGCSLILLALMSFSLSSTHGAEEDPYPSIMIPIYPTGHNIKPVLIGSTERNR
jgi:hypothetical protein